MINPSRQLLLAALLRYTRHGDTATFARACESAGLPVQALDRYAQADLFFALHIVGLIETDYSDGIREWHSAAYGDVCIVSHSPKLIGTSAKWFKDNMDRCRTVVRRQTGETLVLGVDGDLTVSRPGFCDWRRHFLRRLPPLPKVEGALVRGERFPTDLTDCILQRFDPERCSWLVDQQSEVPPRSFVRMRKGFAGWSYWVTGPGSKLALAIADPDWAFLLAARILGWPREQFLVSERSGLRLRRAFRLPALLARFLFANSRTVSIGPNVQFADIDDETQAALLGYLALEE